MMEIDTDRYLDYIFNKHERYLEETEGDYFD